MLDVPVMHEVMSFAQVGAQNAGKSSLINAMRRVVGKKSKTKDVTTAPLLGTTLGASALSLQIRKHQALSA